MVKKQLFIKILFLRQKNTENFCAKNTFARKTTNFSIKMKFYAKNTFASKTTNFSIKMKFYAKNTFASKKFGAQNNFYAKNTFASKNNKFWRQNRNFDKVLRKKNYMRKHITHFRVKIVTFIKFCVQKTLYASNIHFGAKTQLLRRRKKLKREKKNKYVAPFYRSIIFKNTN